MSSIDSLTAAIRVALDQARNLLAGIRVSREDTTEVRDRLAMLGVTRSARFGRA